MQLSKKFKEGESWKQIGKKIKNIVKLKFAIAGAIKEHLKENFIMS